MHIPGTGALVATLQDKCVQLQWISDVLASHNSWQGKKKWWSHSESMWSSFFYQAFQHLSRSLRHCYAATQCMGQCISIMDSRVIMSEQQNVRHSTQTTTVCLVMSRHTSWEQNQNWFQKSCYSELFSAFQSLPVFLVGIQELSLKNK